MAELEPQFPATPAIDGSAIIPVASLAYSSALTRTRPGILTAVAVISIVVSCLSALACLIGGLYVIGFWVMLSIMPRMPQATPLPAGPLTAAQVVQVANRVQSSVPQGLNSAQFRALTAALAAPNQKLVPPQYAWSPLRSAVRVPNSGLVVIVFSNGSPFGGSRLTIDAMGHTTRVTNAQANPFARLKISRVPLGIMLGEDIASLALAIYLLVIGILMLRDSPSSRKAHLRYAFIKIFLSLVAVGASFTLAAQFFSSMNTVGAPSMLMLLPSFIVFAVLTLAYPVALLITLNTADARRYYAEAR